MRIGGVEVDPSPLATNNIQQQTTMKTNDKHDAHTRFQLELIDREIRAVDRMMKLYVWGVMPLVLGGAGYLLHCLF